MQKNSLLTYLASRQAIYMGCWMTIGVFLLAGCAGSTQQKAERGKVQGGTLDRLTEARTAMQTHPGDAEYCYRYGNALYDLGIYGEAGQAYQQALRLKPDMAKAYTNLGLTLRRLGQAGAAIGAYEEALKLDPDDIVTLDNLRSAAQWSGDQERIAFALRRLAELEPERIRRQLPWGEYLYRSGQYLEAAEVYERIVRLDSDIPDYYYLLGLCYFDGQHWAEAEAAWKRGLERAPEQPSIHKALAVLYWSQGDYARAWHAVKQCQALNIPLDPEFLDSLKQDSEKNTPGP